MQLGVSSVAHFTRYLLFCTAITSCSVVDRLAAGLEGSGAVDSQDPLRAIHVIHAMHAMFCRHSTRETFLGINMTKGEEATTVFLSI